ncbi:hypothetical protein NQ317_008404 [Molorchus minor]|uniref:Uncharacterized protein n=1 Tax=Molorchus minor TaxID=1323400 RepID=A0ABQ9K770_9CUCU|nr:hypothetical protein NQ317_008404 [Molorchus minor]
MDLGVTSLTKIFGIYNSKTAIITMIRGGRELSKQKADGHQEKRLTLVRVSVLDVGVEFTKLITMYTRDSGPDKRLAVARKPRCLYAAP